MSKGDGFGHEKPFEGKTNDWITPRWVIEAFGSLSPSAFYFHLDPCASLTQPWKTASRSYTIKENGLAHEWGGGAVWLNPPYGPHTSAWVRRLAEYGDGVALIFARLETELWQDFIFPTADAYLFPRGRIAFARPDGTYPESTSGAPSAFIAWGERHKQALKDLCLSGKIEGAFQDRAIGLYVPSPQLSLFK